MKTKIKSLVIENLKYKVSKDQVIKILKSENISLKAYNSFLFKILLELRNQFEVIGPTKKFNVGTFLDKEFLQGDLLLENRRKREEAQRNDTLFEKENIPTKYYANTMHLSYRLLGKMITKDEVLERFKECSTILGLNRDIGEKCAEHLEEGLQTYILRTVSKCNGRTTVPNLKTSLEKYLRLFNGLDMF
ncbi:uncharacterized protein Eint_111950 [Encephalitozoon intestinalis ATCC 50506]|uniref:Uncharacterized protein n=1 Tax=Encephalitozoon intestinalis (strain ATCC 50506) TaxID=876142 RepID=E0SA72_ENCIT|nr:uncharacterized protein Eint_111950 [Encephalitozoon intestinalis ATCC 50506]ADM12694.2 hypothetical protein Eint_111950 [Encephalitozoon intestinalis ATCC 50506]UTX46556.1 nonsense transcripts 2-like protein [Encephalitozoon intestinalis]